MGENRMSWFKSKQEQLAANLYDEQVYARVAAEISNNEMWPGLWAKAFVQTNGHEQQAKAIYIKLRASQIKLGVDAQNELVNNVMRSLNEDEASIKKGKQAIPDSPPIDPPESPLPVEINTWGLSCGVCGAANVEPPDPITRRQAYCCNCSRYLRWGTETISAATPLKKRKCRHCGSENLGLVGDFKVVMCRDCNKYQS